jgi:hypothetical protein
MSIGDAHHRNVGRLHHFDVFIQPVGGGVFVVIGRAEEDLVGP